MTGPEKLRAWRDRTGLSQSKAARLLGVAQGTWSAWEDGRKRPELEFLLELEKATRREVKLADWVLSADERAARSRRRGKQDGPRTGMDG